MLYTFKTLRKIKTSQFCKYANGEIYTCEVPDLLSKTSTLLELINYANKFDNAIHLRWVDYEMVDIEVKVILKEEKSKQRKWKDHGS